MPEKRAAVEAPPLPKGLVQGGDPPPPPPPSKGKGAAALPPVPSHDHPHTHPEIASQGSPAAPIITLTTDIGWAYAAQMKGVLLRGSPSARIVDITHAVSNHSVLEGAFLLRYSAAQFPPGSIHVCVVDPGVGSARKALIVRSRDGSLMVGPDNGVLMPLARYLGDPEAFQIQRERVVGRGAVSATFEGRDLFAPTAALLSMGHPPEELGTPTKPLSFQLPQPHSGPGSAEVSVLHIDTFGNVITNLPFDEFVDKIGPFGTHALVQEGARQLRATVARTYGDLAEGCLGILGSSFGLAEIAIGHGRADQVLSIRLGARLHLKPSEQDWRE